MHVGCHLSIHPFDQIVTLKSLTTVNPQIFQQLNMHAHVHHHRQERSNEPMNGSFCLVLANFHSLKYFHILDASKCKGHTNITNKQTKIYIYTYMYTYT
jgi:hypothetical protein